MPRLTLDLHEVLYDSLRKQAYYQDRSMADILREAAFAATEQTRLRSWFHQTIEELAKLDRVHEGMDLPDGEVARWGRLAIRIELAKQLLEAACDGLCGYCSHALITHTGSTTPGKEPPWWRQCTRCTPAEACGTEGSKPVTSDLAKPPV
jgi:hypothetical protein